jgi:hypothetical protein
VLRSAVRSRLAPPISHAKGFEGDSVRCITERIRVLSCLPGSVPERFFLAADQFGSRFPLLELHGLLSFSERVSLLHVHPALRRSAQHGGEL